jgi:hypothetical protein
MNLPELSSKLPPPFFNIANNRFINTDHIEIITVTRQQGNPIQFLGNIPMQADEVVTVELGMSSGRTEGVDAETLRRLIPLLQLEVQNQP